MFRRKLLCSAILVLSACTKQMAIQPRYEPQGQSDFFEDKRVERNPIPGTVPAKNEDAATESEVTKDFLMRGQQRYVISCSPCHDRTGAGNGAIVQSGFSKPEPLDSPALRSIKTQALVEIIRDGKGSMAGYRGLITQEDMTAIAHYVKVLQLRKHVPAAWLSESDRKALEAQR